MQTICQICLDQNPLIMLICSHQICLQCAESLKKLQQSQLQNKYWVECPNCHRKTFSYDFQNLLIDTHELSQLTDRSQQQTQLNESQLNIQSEPILFQRRRSMNAIGVDNIQGPINVTPIYVLYSESKRFDFPIKKIQTSTKDTKKQLINSLNQDKIWKLISPKQKIQDKKPGHKRCNTGIPDNQKNGFSINQNKYYNKQKTNPITQKSKNLSIFDYLLSLSHTTNKKIGKRLEQTDITAGFKENQRKFDKNRCLSQIILKNNISKSKKGNNCL